MTEKNKLKFTTFVRGAIQGVVDDAILFDKGEINYSELCLRLRSCEDIIVNYASKKAERPHESNFLDIPAHELKRLMESVELARQLNAEGIEIVRKNGKN